MLCHGILVVQPQIVVRRRRRQRPAILLREEDVQDVVGQEAAFGP
jgi:hypothetical protein